jgi:ribosomal protein L16 Arg81 hydroxylase
MLNQAPKSVGLAGLIAPILPEDFIREHWERKPLHIARRDAHYYEWLLTNENLEAIISSTDLRYPAIQLAKNGAYLAAEVYTRNIKHGSEFFNGVPDIAQIQSEYRSGATVVLPALHRTWTPLRELCETLENEFSHPVHANAYLTPGDSPGFTPHYDTHEVFVLQVAGSKRWRLFEPPLKLPHRTQPFAPTAYVPPAPILELELRQGDLLYVPRGYVHAAHTSQTHSAHVTVGMTVYTWVELFSEMVASSKELAEFRTALPPRFTSDESIKRTLKDGLMQRFEQLRANCDADRVVDDFLQRVRSSHTRSGAAFSAEARVISLQTQLRTPEPSDYRISTEDRGVILQFAGRKFVLPDKIRITIDEMCSKRSFRPEELAGPLDNTGKINLVRDLYQELFLTLVE